MLQAELFSQFLASFELVAVSCARFLPKIRLEELSDLLPEPKHLFSHITIVDNPCFRNNDCIQSKGMRHSRRFDASNLFEFKSRSVSRLAVLWR